MRSIYWLVPETGLSTESDTETYLDNFNDVTAPGLQWSVGASWPGVILWGPTLGGPLHFIYHGRTWAATR